MPLFHIALVVVLQRVHKKMKAKQKECRTVTKCLLTVFELIRANVKCRLRNRPFLTRAEFLHKVINKQMHAQTQYFENITGNPLAC